MGIRGRLLALAIVIAIPLGLVGLAGLWEVWRASRAALDESVERSAELAAVAFDRWIEGQRLPLTATAAYVAEKPERTRALQDSLRFDLATRAHWIDLRIVDESGATEVAYRSNLPALSTELVAEVFDDMRRRRAWAIETDWTRGPKQPAFMIAVPIIENTKLVNSRNTETNVQSEIAERSVSSENTTESQITIGSRAVIARVEAAALTGLFRDMRTIDSAVITIYDSRQRILYRSLTRDEHIGMDVKRSSLLASLGSQPATTIEVNSPVDGIKRIYGVARAGNTECLVTVGVPSSVLYAPAYRQMKRNLLLSLAALLLAVSAAVVIARGIAPPMRRLSNAARRLGAGDLTARAPAAASGEVAELAQTFNHMAARIEERERRLTELDRLKTEFVGGVSHELRTPLTTIKTLTRVLRRGRASAAEQREYLDTIAAQCDRQIDLVLNLLDLSRIEAGAYILAPTRVDVEEIMRTCHQIERHAAEMRGQDFRLIIPTELPHVQADYEALRRVICSLIENSFKYTPNGGRITLEARSSGEEIAIIVHDTGRGIAPEDAPHIFEKFYRGRAVATSTEGETDTPDYNESVAHADVPGVGLGLYLAQAIVKQLGGRIDVASAVGRGSTFTIYLPVTEIYASDEGNGAYQINGQTRVEDGVTKEEHRIGSTARS